MEITSLKKVDLGGFKNLQEEEIYGKRYNPKRFFTEPLTTDYWLLATDYWLLLINSRKLSMEKKSGWDSLSWRELDLALK